MRINDIAKRIKYNWYTDSDIDYYPTNNSNLLVYYGTIQNTGYITFCCTWIGLQFRVSNTDLAFRIKYGGSGWLNWKTITTA